MTNRLAREKSPYLLQHAENPVNWYPWSDEAFARAIAEDKPVFLSIGYSTCHWCHVMERESFEDDEVAGLLNDTFICIKVDREERPDIDNIYMTVCSMMTGGGGWPLTIIMTPDRKPFFAGTYFGKYSQQNRIGMLDMIPRLQELWHTKRDEIMQSTVKIIEILEQQNRSAPGSGLDREILHDAFKQLSERYDDVNAGFSNAPKFPTPHNLTFLLRYWHMTGNEQALSMAEQTLSAMRRGGIYDHLGFGFHRYSTDAQWLLPHFEKMLYDEALLAVAYLEAYLVSSNQLFKRTADEIFSYVLRDMSAPEGGFYSAEDADSEGVEGKFYVWSLDEIKQILTADEAEFIKSLYNIQDKGNFHDEASGLLTGANILHLSRQGLPDSADSSFDIEAIRQKLFAYREKRVHPHKDDKILTDWNGLMIGAYAMGARVLDNTQYLEAAEKAVQFIFSSMRDDQELLHRYRDGESAVHGMLCDYAFMVWGLLELYQAGFKIQFLKQAISLNQIMLDLFWDDEEGGFFLTPEGGEQLLVRPKELYDGALPSGNSVALSNLLRLERLTGDAGLGQKADQLVRAFSKTLKEVPSGYTHFLGSLSFALAQTTEIVIVGDPGSADTQEMLSVLGKTFSPYTVTLFKDSTTDSDQLARLAPFAADHSTIDNRATAYVCENFRCRSPFVELEKLQSFLQKK